MFELHAVSLYITDVKIVSRRRNYLIFKDIYIDKLEKCLVATKISIMKSVLISLHLLAQNIWKFPVYSWVQAS